MAGFIARRMALAGVNTLRGAFGKLIRKGAPKAQRAGSRANKGKPLKKSGATTIRGINIGTKAGKKFGETVKNQPKRIAGQDPVGMRPKEMNKGGGLVEATNKLKAQGLNIGGEPKKIVSVTKGDDGSVTTVYSDKSMKKVRDGKVVRRGGPLTPKMKMDRLKKNMLKNKMSSFKDGGSVRGKARGMGAATKGGGYNV